jgi:hypothetical protein
MNENAIHAEIGDQRISRTVFLRDVAVFQGKLMLDGLRDIILFPVSFLAAAVDCLSRDASTGRHFYEVMHFARETERWVNLFEAADRAPDTQRPRPSISGPGLDEMIGKARVRADARGRETGAGAVG